MKTNGNGNENDANDDKKQAPVDSGGGGKPPAAPSSSSKKKKKKNKSALDQDAEAKRRGRRPDAAEMAVAAAKKPPPAAAFSAVAAAANKPGVYSVSSNDRDDDSSAAVSAKIRRENNGGGGGGGGGDPPGRSASAFQTVLSGSSLEDRIAAKIRGNDASKSSGVAPSSYASSSAGAASAVPGAMSSSSSSSSSKLLSSLDDKVAAKIRIHDGASAKKNKSTPPSGVATATAATISLEDKVAAKIRGEDGARKAKVPSSDLDDKIAAKIRGDSSGNAATASASAASFASSVAASSAAVAITTMTTNSSTRRVESSSSKLLDDRIAAKLRGEKSSGNSDNDDAFGVGDDDGNDDGFELTKNTKKKSLDGTNEKKKKKKKFSKQSSLGKLLFGEDEDEAVFADDEKKTSDSSFVGGGGGVGHKSSNAKKTDSFEEVVGGGDKEKGFGKPEQALDPDNGFAPNLDVEFGTTTAANGQPGAGGAGGQGLAVAVAVEEDDYDEYDDDGMFIPSAVEYDPDAKPPMYRNRRFRLYGLLAVIVVVLVAIGAAVGGTVGKKDDGDEGDTAPTAAPTAYRESLGIEAQIVRVVGTEVLEDPESPYARALNWITWDDPMQITPEATNFVQRFTAAYWYFATTEDGPWRTCNPPDDPWSGETDCVFDQMISLFPLEFEQVPWSRWLSNTSECNWAALICDDQVRARHFFISFNVHACPVWRASAVSKKQEISRHIYAHKVAIHFFLSPVVALQGQVRAVDIGKYLQLLLVPVQIPRARFALSIASLSNVRSSLLLFLLHVSYASLRFVCAAAGGLSGNFPEGIYNWPFLQSIRIMWANLRGPLPPELVKMKHLVNIEMHFNSFTGSIPEEWWSARNLQRINLGENLLSGSIQSSIHNLRDLKGLFIMTNAMTGSIPPEIGSMDSLNYLRYVFANRELDARSLSLVFGWRRTNNFLQVRSFRFTLGYWASASISRNSMEGQWPDSIENWKNVQEMWAHRNLMTGTLPEGFGKMQNLIDWRVHINQLNGKSCYFEHKFDRLVSDDMHLTKLRLFSNAVVVSFFAGTIPDSTYDLPNIDRLDFYENQFSGTLSPLVGNLGDSLYTLRLSQNNFHGPIPTEFAELHKIATVWLDDNDFTGTVPASLCTNATGIELFDLFEEFQADCAPSAFGSSPEIACACCTSCCKKGGDECLPVVPEDEFSNDEPVFL